MRYMWKRNTSKFEGQEKQNVTSTLPWNETTLLSRFVIVDSVSSIPTNPNAKYVLVIPRRIKKIIGTAILERNDQQAATIAGRMMDSMNNLDGLACSPRKFKNITLNVDRRLSNEEWKGLFNTTWCNFARREWSIQIRNSGNIEKVKFGENHNVTFQMCNLVNGPLVLRKEKFVQLNGLRPDFGRLSLLDFFLRSNGTLKIGKFGNCFYSDELFNIDRGPRIADEFPEYSHFDVTHGVLRIIKEDRIEWTKCVATNKHCKEEPYIAPTTLPQIGQPICCSVVLGEMLKDLVTVFTKLGIDYRVVYGTLLGGERSGAIIPYTYDIDMTIEEKFSRDGLMLSRMDPLLQRRWDSRLLSLDFFGCVSGSVDPPGASPFSCRFDFPFVTVLITFIVGISEVGKAWRGGGTVMVLVRGFLWYPRRLSYHET
ncbi:hypothetical protein QZH41_005596, partial [Actinostola sp. cb2023]